MNDKGYVTGRMLMHEKQKEQVKTLGLGDIIEEMISIGDPKRPTASGRRGLQERYTILKEELNTRLEGIPEDEEVKTEATTDLSPNVEKVLKQSVGKKVLKKDGSTKRTVGK